MYVVSILLDEQTGPDGQPTVAMKRFVHVKFHLRRWQFPDYLRSVLSDTVAFLTDAVVDALRREQARRRQEQAHPVIQRQ